MPNIIEITDFSAPELDVYARLTQAQLRNRLEPEKGLFIAESPKVIARALDAGYQRPCSWSAARSPARPRKFCAAAAMPPYTRPTAKCWPA